MPARRIYSRVQRGFLLMQLLGDIVFCFVGVYAGYWLRFATFFRHVGVGADVQPDFRSWSALLLLGTAFLIGTCAYLGLYDSRLLLRTHRAVSIIIRGTSIWFLIFLSTSLILKFQPAISRIFVALSCLTVVIAMTAWRFLFYALISYSRWVALIVQQVAVVGWSEEASRLYQAVSGDRNHAYNICGVVTTNSAHEKPLPELPVLGRLAEIDAIVKAGFLDIVVVADLDLPKEQLLSLAETCERHYVAFKVIPSFFQIFVSNLRMQTISGVPILGVEALASQTFTNQMIKRTTDLLGSFVGLILSFPLMVTLAILIKRESPGPAIYRQTRVGQHGKPFTIYKLRSMHLNAESQSGARWADPQDPRRLKIGAFMREWNLDELPQFWNILLGDMSLVGPRPERPELIAQFAYAIPHYSPRHEMRPGLTGWAQVNGLRGNTSLAERIRYDLYYIENWSFWFDFQILLLTFVQHQNAY
jgi:exopolysaccharide biosynthesis polyprenyl glycosylphosphotransferase